MLLVSKEYTRIAAPPAFAHRPALTSGRAVAHMRRTARAQTPPVLPHKPPR